MLAIDLIILINVIDLSHQIIEFGKDRNDRYCKLLTRNLKDGVMKTFSCPRRVEKRRFQWQ